MFWLLAFSIASDFQSFIVRISLCLSLVCLVPVAFFLTIDISLFLFKFFVDSSTETYATIKRQLSDTNLGRSFSFPSLTGFSQPLSSNTSVTGTTTLKALNNRIGTVPPSALSESPAPPSLFSISRQKPRLPFNIGASSSPTFLTTILAIRQTNHKSSLNSNYNHRGDNTALWTQLRSYIFRDSIRLQKRKRSITSIDPLAVNGDDPAAIQENSGLSSVSQPAASSLSKSTSLSCQSSNSAATRPHAIKRNVLNKKFNIDKSKFTESADDESENENEGLWFKADSIVRQQALTA